VVSGTRKSGGGLGDVHAPGATPLTPDELQGLRLPARTHGDLNALEAENILAGWRWALRSTTSRLPRLLTDEYLRALHRRMFGQVWSWAGDLRMRQTNIGVAPHEIAVHLRQVLEDAAYWVEHGTYPATEIAVRLHHRVVLIHPFANGNGRHARMLADVLLVRHFELPRLQWGGPLLDADGARRTEYLEALRAADHHDYSPLLKFCAVSGA
jgi:Fic-DOC domain mobile mystery protein B